MLLLRHTSAAFVQSNTHETLHHLGLSEQLFASAMANASDLSPKGSNSNALALGCKEPPSGLAHVAS